MTPDFQNDDAAELVSALLDGGLSEEAHAELAKALAADAALRDAYYRQVRIHAQLVWNSRRIPSVTFDPAGIKTNMPAKTFVPGILGSGFRNTLGYLASGWPAAYLIATVICGIGLTIAAFTYVSQPTDIARHSNNSNPQSLIANPSPKATIVARITGSVDCRWERKAAVASGEWRVASEGREERGEGREKVQGSRLKVQGGKNPKSPNTNPQSLIPNPSLATNHYPLTTRHKSLVCLGDQFILSAGLMEITYNTGAKVILQGPCTYDVDSPAGGFLEIGKLTARVEKSTKYGVRSTVQVASDGMKIAKCKLQNANYQSPNPEIPKSQNPSLTTNHYPLTTNSNPQSPIPNPSSSPQPLAPSPLFAVRTPTAVITDLGTEFGVEVDKAGATTSHVFQGAVRVQTVAAEGKAEGTAQILHENESAHVNGSDLSMVDVASAKPDGFVRVMPKPQPRSHLRVLAHFRMGEDDTGAVAGKPCNDATSGRIGRVKAIKSGSSRYTADVAAPNSTLAVEFIAKEKQCYAVPYVLTAEIDNIGIEAWVKPGNNKDDGAIVWNGDMGWGLLQRGDVLCCHLNGIGDVGAFKFTIGRWYHVAMVRDNGLTTFYVDGNPVKTDTREATIPWGRFWIGCTEEKYYFDGAIDEIRVFEFNPGEFRPQELLVRKAKKKPTDDEN